MFGAWTNLVDIKAGNTLDTVITENGRGIVRHYLQDVGSTFCTGALTAPFAFLGSKYDDRLRKVYTSVTTDKIALSRGMLAAIFDDALMDTTPLSGLLDELLTLAGHGNRDAILAEAQAA